MTIDERDGRAGERKGLADLTPSQFADVCGGRLDVSIQAVLERSGERWGEMEQRGSRRITSDLTVW